MEIIQKLLCLFFWQSLVFAQLPNEDIVDPSTNYVFDLPDIVANYRTIGEEVQLEAFGAREVNGSSYLSYVSHFSYPSHLSFLSHLS
jgi:hypothetical protein